MPEGLKIIIGADIRQAQAATKQIVTDLDKTGRSFTALERKVNSFGGGVKTFSTNFKGVGKSVKEVVPQVERLSQSIETLRARIGARKDFLIRETDISKIKQYKQEIRELEAELVRVQAIGSGGIGQALGPVGTGAGKAFSFLKQAAFVLPGLGIAGLLGGLTDLVVGLFKTGDAFNQTEIDAAKFANQIANAKAGVEEFAESLDFGAELDKLRAKLQFGEGFQADVIGLKVDKDANQVFIDEANAEIRRVTDRIGTLRANAAFILSKSGQQLLDSFFIDLEIPDDLVKKLSSADQAIFNEIKAGATRVEALSELRRKKTKENDIADLQLQLKTNAESARLREKAADDFEKFVTQTIAKARELSSFLEKRGILEIGAGFEVDPRKSKIQNLDKAREFIRKALNAEFGFIEIIIPQLKIINPNDAELMRFIDKSNKDLEKRFEDMTKRNPILIETEVLRVQRRTATDEAAEAEAKRVEFLANTINDVLTPSFQGLFDAIREGENPIKAFLQGIGQAVLQLIQKLIQAVALAAILNALGLGGKGEGFGAIFGKLLGLQGGGLVTGPTLAAIGEGSGTSLSNPEVVAPLDQLKQMLEGVGGGQRVHVSIDGIVRGEKMQLVLARTSRKQRRLG